MAPRAPDPATDARRLRAVLVFAGTLAFVLSPVFAGGLHGLDPALSSAERPMIPARWAFTIWWPIHGWLLLHATIGLAARSDDPHWDLTRLPLLLALVPGAIWIPAAGMSPSWATVLIWVMWAGALTAALAADPRVRWTLARPLALLAGWLTVLAPSSLAALAATHGLIDPEAAALPVIVLAVGLGWLSARALPAPIIFLAAEVWGLVGLADANWPDRPAGAALALMGAAVLLVRMSGLRAAVR